jgi:hypothetical protein
MATTRQRRGLAMVAAALVVVSPIEPAEAQDTNEFWPELQVHYWFNDHRSRVIALVASGRNRDTDATYQAEQGLLFEHQFTSYFLGRAGYEHVSATDGGEFFENRALLEQTFRLYLPWQVIGEYRTREDLRWLNTGFSARLRERLQVSRDFTIDRYTFTPYASAEVYFDTRYGTFSRYRLQLGVTLPITRSSSIEPYVVRQDDWIPNGVLTNAFGLTLVYAF